jgi:hypothetical protein
MPPLSIRDSTGAKRVLSGVLSLARLASAGSETLDVGPQPTAVYTWTPARHPRGGGGGGGSQDSGTLPPFPRSRL